MPSVWSAVANSAWNRRRSKRMPSASGTSKARVHRFLGGEDGGQRHRCDPFRHRQRFFQETRSGHNARHEPGALGFGGIHHAAGQNQIHRFGLADRARQPLRAADAGNDPELDLRLAELGILGGDHDVALHGELAAAAERETGHRGDDRLARVRGRVPGAGEIPHEHVDARTCRPSP